MTQRATPHPFADHPDKSERAQLRKVLRRQRRALSASAQRDAANNLALNLLTHRDLIRSRHIAIYLPNDGEIDPLTFMHMARRRSVQFYLPVLHPVHEGKLSFTRFDEQTRLFPNRFGIPEPAFRPQVTRPAWTLDAVLFPLVGFDTEGGRLGMGGGFYDRTFAFSRLRPAMAPKLIGLAHDFQRVEQLPIEPWDIPLHGVVTDRHRYRFRGDSTL
ncbi:5-formyltetrahydrofolate cyclo-ligase [Marinobacter salinisoli]|uniref:5-formyltetrahydrofolate cyclo-ligase n=1 Tax=Marinobacter salinisoli TaxID=2769486 RepID=A0ABX7MRZ9_9GAMM|nr:5-formyltetrahydrofolate cyclo-ligase [Marinobacter salinisoli]QSP95155.1 5-formyltetrahydrofolate cyclo-ligase [Marinobacter salinisoli]